MSEYRKIIDYTSPEYSDDVDDNGKLWSSNGMAIWYNVAEEIRARTQFWQAELQNQVHNRLVSQSILLSDDNRAILKKYGIKEIEPKVVSTYVQNVTDNIFKGHFTGRIHTVFNQEGSIDAATLDLIIAMVKQDIGFDDMLRELTKVGISEGFFPFLKVDVVDSDVGNGRLKLKLYSANAVLPAQNEYRTGSDVEDMILIDLVDTKSLYLSFEDKKEMIDEYMEQYNTDYVTSNSKRQTMIQREETQRRFDELKLAPNGSPLSNRDYTVVYTWLRKAVAEVMCFIDYKSSNEIILTPDWDEKRIQNFLLFNPTYTLVERKRFVCWETTITDRGMLLRNRMYPVQIPKGDRDITLPGVCYVPNIIAGKPECFTDTIKDDLENYALACSLGQDAILTAGGKTLTYAEGTFADNTDMNEVRKQFMSRFGMIETTIQGFNTNRLDVQQVNESFINYSNVIKARLEETSGITQEMQGRVQAGSSNFRTKTAILQSLSSKSEYIRNLTTADLQLTNILLYLFCMTTTDEEVYGYFDSPGSQTFETVNQIGVDHANRIIRVKNDLRKGQFRYIITEQSTSKLNDDISRDEFQDWMLSVGQSLFTFMAQDPLGTAKIMQSYPIPAVKRMGEDYEKSFLKGQEQAAQGIPPEGEEMLDAPDEIANEGEEYPSTIDFEDDTMNPEIYEGVE